MRLIKKWAIRGIALIVFLLMVVMIGIEIKKDSIVNLVVAGINDNINGTFSHSMADVSFLTTLPNLRISLYDVEVSDNSDLAPLANFNEISLSINLGFIFTKEKEPELRELLIRKGTINAIVLDNGTNNYSIQKKTTNGANKSSINFHIEEYVLNDIDINYINHESNQLVKLQNGLYRGSLNYIDDHILINGSSRTEITYSASSMSPTVLLNVKSGMQIKSASDFSVIQINKGNISINKLNLGVVGDFDGTRLGYNYDLAFNGDGNEVKHIASLLSSFNNDQFGELMSTGTLDIAGRITGNTNNAYPKYKIHAGVIDGSLSYPKGMNNLKEIEFSIDAENSHSSQPISTLSIDDITLISNRSSIAGALSYVRKSEINTLKSDLSINMDLREIQQIAPYSDIGQLQGAIAGEIKGNVDIDDYGHLSDISTFTSNLTLQSIEYQSVNTSTAIESSFITGDENHLLIDINDIELQNNFAGDFNLNIKSPFSLLLDSNQEVEVRTKVNLDYFTVPNTTSNDEAVIYTIPTLYLPLSLHIDQLEYGNYSIQGIKANGHINNGDSDIDFSIDQLNGQSLAGTANLNHLLDYALNNDTLTGSIYIQSDDIHIDRLIDSGDGSVPDSSNTLIPSNIDIGINYNSQNVTYQNITLRSASGQIAIGNQQIIFKNEAEIFGGRLGVTGVFDANIKVKPNIELSGQISNSLLSEGTKAIPFASNLLPIGEFIEGQFNTTINWDSELTTDYFPVFNTITSNGFLETSNGRINGLKPLSELTKYLTDDIAQIWQVANTKSWFVIKDGFVILDEINLSQKNVDIRLSGAISLDGEMDYLLKLSAPVNDIKLDELGEAIYSINDQLSKLKVIDDFTNIDLSFALKGTVASPILKLTGANISSISSGKTIDHVLEEKVAQEIDQAINKVDSITNEVKTEIENQVDSVQTTLDSIIDSEKQILEREAKEILDSLKAGNIDIFKNIDSLFMRKKQGVGGKIKLPKLFEGLE